MKRIILMSLLLMSSTALLQAQNKLSIEINAEPQEGCLYEQNKITNSTSPSIQADYGINANFMLSNKLSIGTGVFYTNKGYRTGGMILDNLSYDEPKEVEVITAISNKYVEVPAIIRLNLKPEKNTSYLKFGISYMHLFAVKSVTKKAPDPILNRTLSEFKQSFDSYHTGEALNGTRRHTLGLWLACGKTFPVNEHIQWGGELLFKPIILPLLEHYSDNDRYLYSVGVNLYLNLNFNKS